MLTITILFERPLHLASAQLNEKIISDTAFVKWYYSPDEKDATAKILGFQHYLQKKDCQKITRQSFNGYIRDYSIISFCTLTSAFVLKRI